MPNDFLSQLIQQSNTLPSPLMTEEEKLRREEEELRKEDPTAFSSAIEDELEVSQKPIAPPITQKEIDTMKEYPRSPAEDRLSQEMDVAEQLGSPVESDNRSSVDMLKDMIPEQPAEKNKYQEILEAYRSLRPKQEGYENQLQNLAIQQGMNQIAQGMARGYGAEIGAGEEGIKALKEQAAEPLNAIKRQMDTGKQAMGLEDEMQMMDPGSDVSKFYREQAYALLKKLKPDSDYTGKLENMSASQLQKLPGMKNLGAQSSNRGVGFGQFVNKKGEPIVALPDNTLFNTVTQKPHDPSEGIVRPIGYIDQESGYRGYAGPGSFTKFGKESAPRTTVNDQGVKEAEKPKTYGDYRRAGIITPKEFDSIVNKDKEGFEQQNAPKMSIISGLDSVETLAKEAITNPNAAASLGGIIGSLFEPGKLTDEDALRYIREKGIINIAPNWVKESTIGTIKESTADNIVKTAKAYRKALDTIVRKNAINYASRTKTALVRGEEVDPNVLADFYYMPTNQDFVQQKTNKPKAGSIITVKGKRYQVAEDGDTLIPINK